MWCLKFEKLMTL